MKVLLVQDVPDQDHQQYLHSYQNHYPNDMSQNQNQVQTSYVSYPNQEYDHEHYLTEEYSPEGYYGPPL